jgi:hypothetical protein
MTPDEEQTENQDDGEETEGEPHPFRDGKSPPALAQPVGRMSSSLCHCSAIPDLNRAEGGKRAARFGLTAATPFSLMRALGEIFDGHDHVAVIERNMRRGRKLECDPAGSDLFDREMNRSHPDFEEQGQADFAKPGIGFLDPVLKPVGRERGHVPGEHEMDEISDGFALLLGPRMQLDHGRF